MIPNDTICAVATAAGEAGVSVIRVSGPESLASAEKVFTSSSSDRKPGSFVHGTVHEPGNPDAHIDDALMLIFKSPHSYTGEDSVEIQCHGGTVCSRRVLESLIKAGVRQAEPGEFTRRAFLNGRIDLLQAEAVADLIHAQSDRAADSALRQLEGNVSHWYREIYDDIVSAASSFEASLDFPEEELPSSIYEEPIKKIEAAKERLAEALETWNDGRLLQEGVQVAIAGRPNAGKSSLFNALLGYERAIVTHVAGTTRDTVDDAIVINGVVIHLTDTAGLRESNCHIEAEGISRAQKAVSRSDLTLYVVDASVQHDPDEIDELKQLDPSATLIVLNKSDLPSGAGSVVPSDMSSCRCSCTTGDGIQDLKEQIFSHIEGYTPSQLNSMNQRHRTLVTEALEAARKASALASKDPESEAALIASELRTAALAIGTIIGTEYHKDLLDNIFQRFCIGK
jgi:tRNA modification GTPase